MTRRRILSGIYMIVLMSLALCATALAQDILPAALARRHQNNIPELDFR